MKPIVRRLHMGCGESLKGRLSLLPETRLRSVSIRRGLETAPKIGLTKKQRPA